jgi:hypothetical protein
MSKYCNGRKKGRSDLEKIDPGEQHGGEGYCENDAGAGTQHEGAGRCRFHGGLQDGDGRLTSGLYSENAPDVLADRIQQARESVDVEDLEEEIHLMRAALDRLTESFDTLPPDEIERLVKVASKVTRTVERLHKIRYGEQQTIRLEEVDQFVSTVQDTIRREWENCETAEEMIEAVGETLERPEVAI